MTKGQKTLNGKAVADREYLGVLITKSTDRLVEVLSMIDNTLRELLGSKTTFPTAATSPPEKSSPPPQAGELPPDLLAHLKKKSENAYEVVDASILDKNNRLTMSDYLIVKQCGWGYSPAKKLIWKPKERR
jgi:hypothetical protein